MSVTPARLSLLAGVVLALAAPASAQPATAEAKSATPSGPAQGADPQKPASPFDDITWVEPGSAAKLGTLASFTVPEKC